MKQKNNSGAAEIFSAVPGDADSIALLEKECFSSPWSKKQISDEIDNPQAVFITAKKDGRLCGYVSGRNAAGEFYISNIAVLPSVRRKGTAALLMSELLERVRLCDCTFATLEVRKSNTAAKALYEKFGFVFIGIRKNFYTAPVEDACIYTLYF